MRRSRWRLYCIDGVSSTASSSLGMVSSLEIQVEVCKFRGKDLPSLHRRQCVSPHGLGQVRLERLVIELWKNAAKDELAVQLELA
jgi:hypothetical protein